MYREVPMKEVGLFEAKQKLSEIVDRATKGERIGITRRGKLAAVLGPAESEIDIDEVFAGMDKIREKSRKPRNVSIQELRDEGRK
jgi:prevent-host-death family protein